VRNVLVANPAEMRPLGRFCHRGKANIKMDFKKTDSDIVEWIHLGTVLWTIGGFLHSVKCGQADY
jgi:hypothetical protein